MRLQQKNNIEPDIKNLTSFFPPNVSVGGLPLLNKVATTATTTADPRTLRAASCPQIFTLAVDKTKFTNLITVTQALSRGEGRLGLAGNTSPKFDEFDLEFPNCTVLSGGKKLSCNNGKWGCAMRASFPNYPRCSDINLKATYYIGADPSNNTRRICYAHTTDTTDRPNRLCQAVTKRKTPNITEAITIFSGDMQMNGYYFRN